MSLKLQQSNFFYLNNTFNSKNIYERQIDWLNQVEEKKKKIKENVFKSKIRSVSPNLNHGKKRFKGVESKTKKYIERYSRRNQGGKTKRAKVKINLNIIF